MITRDGTDWQRELAGAYSEPGDLLARLGIPPEAVATAGGSGFPMRVPESFVRRMAPGDPDDPLLRQVLETAPEQLEVNGFTADPVGDLAARAAPGALHKYHGRVLIIATGACGIHCRYCFRRAFPYADFAPGRGELDRTLEFLAAHPDIDEVILSGGDPLSLGDDRLAELLAAVSAPAQIRRVRLHTRLPVVVGRRVTPRLLATLEGLDAAVVVVIHANHPNELDVEVSGHLRRLAGACRQLLNQSVLLKGVNDSCEALVELSHRLFDADALPYYLHQLDPVAGAAHFQVDDATALALVDCMRARLPGYLVPRLVREEPGAPFKIPLEATTTG